MVVMSPQAEKETSGKDSFDWLHPSPLRGLDQMRLKASGLAKPSN